MITDYPEKAADMADLSARLRAAPERLDAAVADLTPAELEAHPVPNEKTLREVVEHVALVSLGWSDHFFEAIEDEYDSPRRQDKGWRVPLETEAALGVAAALAVYRRHNGFLADFLSRLPATDFRRPFKRVAWLTEPFQINESINWGCVLHCDWHLAQVHVKRLLLGKPQPWLSVFVTRWPDAIRDHQLPPDIAARLPRANP